MGVETKWNFRGDNTVFSSGCHVMLRLDERLILDKRRDELCLS